MKLIIKVFCILVVSISSLIAAKQNTNYDALSTLGSEDAPIVIYNFTSLTCVHCKNFHNSKFEEIKKEYIDTGLAQYKLILINNGGVEQTSAIAVAYLAKNSDDFFRNVSLMLNRQGIWYNNQSKLYEIALSVNVTKINIEELINKDSFIKLIGNLNDLASDAKVRGTPTFVITKKGAEITESLAKIEGNPGYAKIKEKIEKALLEVNE